MRTVVLIPCYNEAPTISSVVKSFKTLAPDIDVYLPCIDVMFPCSLPAA